MISTLPRTLPKACPPPSFRVYFPGISILRAPPPLFRPVRKATLRRGLVYCAVLGFALCSRGGLLGYEPASAGTALSLDYCAERSIYSVFVCSLPEPLPSGSLCCMLYCCSVDRLRAGVVVIQSRPYPPLSEKSFHSEKGTPQVTGN